MMPKLLKNAHVPVAVATSSSFSGASTADKVALETRPSPAAMRPFTDLQLAEVGESFFNKVIHLI
jgi:hypothetical protein